MHGIANRTAGGFFILVAMYLVYYSYILPQGKGTYVG
jgi:hypothetical protein